MRSSGRYAAALVIVLLGSVAPVTGAADAKSGYTATLAREEMLRRDLETAMRGSDAGALLLRRLRSLVSEYEQLARRYPRSGYSDNALYQAARLSADTYWHFRQDVDRRAAQRLFAALKAQFPSSSLNRQVAAHVGRLDRAQPSRARAAPAPATPASPRPDERAVLTAIRRDILPDAVRITLQLEREAVFHEERLDGPPRVFVDLQNTRATDALRDAALAFPDDVVRQVRVGRHVGATRVVLDLQGASRHSVYALYNPYRVVIDFERSTARAAPAPGDARIARSSGEPPISRDEPGASWTPDPSPPPQPAPVRDAGVAPTGGSAPAAPAGIAATGATEIAPAPGAEIGPTAAGPLAPAGGTRVASPSTSTTSPASPAANKAGGFSIARQLGLGIARVAIDAGHGGHDPGARVKGLNEADLTLDVALRLEKMLLAVPGVEVVMTRRTNMYIPLEERTAIANRAGADLFLSIHANASPNPRARGIETYFLNFAPNPEAEAIAARENAASSRTMRNLPDIVKAIALSNKLDESRDFAVLVQSSMYERLRKANREARSLGVKQAPFMVLIGATMPSVLAEISFVTNRQEAGLLRTPAYRQAIAEALFAGISKYQRSLKTAQTAAAQ